MRGHSTLLWLATSACILLATAARCETPEDGLKAYDAGNYALALKIWKPLAEAGNAEAQFRLAYMYGEEKGVTKDKAAYLHWMLAAARQGHPAAEFWMGFSSEWGTEAPLDIHEAARWFRLSADQGNTDAQRSLGDLYETGDGVVQDYVEATELYTAAAEKGDDAAQEDLARQYLEGHGVPRDLVQAHVWYNLAASAHVGDEVRERRKAGREAAAKEMTPAQIAEAQRLAREWKPKS